MTDEQPSSGRILFASSAAGFTSRLLLHPMDTIKTRIVNQNRYDSSAYRNIREAISRMAKQEGIPGFYRGLLPSLVLSAPAQALYLCTYDYAKMGISSMLHPHDSQSQQDSFMVHFVSGFIAESVSCIFWVPHDLIKERIQVNTGTSMGQFRRVWQAIRADGLLNLYKGYWITLSSFGFMSAFYFVFYEQSKAQFRNWRRRRGDFLEHHEATTQPLFPDILLSAAFSITMASILTHPLELIKTRYQIQRQKQNPDTAYKNSLDAVRKIVTHEGGVTTLWKGTSSRLLYAVPNAVIVMLLFEYLKGERVA